MLGFTAFYPTYGIQPLLHKFGRALLPRDDRFNKFCKALD